MQKGFNLADLNVAKADVGVPMAVLNPKTSEPLVFEDEQGSLQPVTITLLGAESGVVRAERRVQVNRRFRRGLAQASKITAEETEAEALTALREMRKQVEANCDYVGPNFAEEARKIHYGESDKRGIYGQTTEEEAAALAEEGIEFGRLPWLPRGN